MRKRASTRAEKTEGERIYLREYIESTLAKRPEMVGAFAAECNRKGIRRATQKQFDAMLRELERRT